MCEHIWGPEYHTHLGHETLGSHAVHYDCLNCGVIWTRYFGEDKVSVLYASYCKKYWTILDNTHKCSAGWRGVVVEFGTFKG